MGITKPIPPKIRQQLASDPFMKRCCLCGTEKGIEWHHNHVMGRRMNDPKTILPVCPFHHHYARTMTGVDRLDYIMFVIRELDINKYKSRDLLMQRKKYLLRNYFLNEQGYPQKRLS